MGGERARAVEITLGPILFHWPAASMRDFYARIADEAPVNTVYIGEVVCSKRAPFLDPHIPDIIERLKRAGKKVILSSLAEVVLPREREMMAALCRLQDCEIEINDAAGAYLRAGAPHRIGQYFNVYNERTLDVLVRAGATHVTLPCELPRRAVEDMAARAWELGVGIEVQVFGRASLALSARCYHARAHGRVKDNCQFVCGENADGMSLSTIDGERLLTVNGVQTLSHHYLCLIAELPELIASGVTALRLSPHTFDMVDVAAIFEQALRGAIGPDDALAQLRTMVGAPGIMNGFWHKQPGASYVTSV